MSGRILIIDSVATNRIVLKVKLLSAQYRVSACASVAEAHESLATDQPDLVLLDMTNIGKDALEFCRMLRADPKTATLPVIGMGHFSSPQDRLPAFEAGIDDTLAKPMPDGLLLARIRSLLRASDAVGELRLREDTSRALGFADGPVAFSRPARVVLLSDSLATSLPFSRHLSDQIGYDVRASEADYLPGARALAESSDLFVIDARHETPGRAANRAFRLVSDLRSRSETRHAAQLFLMPENGADMGAMALDLGASDVVPAEASLSEIALRCRALVTRKLQLDQLRATVQTGLQAAVTDPLTGLYNRRYALPHLAGMAERAARSQRDFAVMAIDLDHFKSINDKFGHSIGDRVLMSISQRLRDGFRAIDLVARIGGEEFLVAMPDTTEEQAKGAAERLRRSVENTPLVVGDVGGPIFITLSIGVAIGCQNAGQEDVAHIMDRADKALYVAKSAGRNTVEISHPAAA